MKGLHTTLVLTVVTAVLVLSLCVGCISPGGQGTPTSTTTTAPPGTTTGATSGGPTVSGTRPPAGSVTAVDFHRLFAVLPTAPSGWTAQEHFGTTLHTDGGAYTMAQQVFTSPGGAQATIMVVDSAYYAIGGWETWGTHTEVQTTEGYWKSGTIQGYPSWEWYDARTGSYSIWVGVRDRFMVLVTLNNGNRSDLDTMVNSVQYGVLASL